MHSVISREKTGREEKGREKEGRSKDALRSRLFFFNEPPGGRGHKRKQKAKSRCILFHGFHRSSTPEKIAGWFCASDGTLIVLVNEA